MPEASVASTSAETTQPPGNTQESIQSPLQQGYISDDYGRWMEYEAMLTDLNPFGHASAGIVDPPLVPPFPFDLNNGEGGSAIAIPSTSLWMNGQGTTNDPFSHQFGSSWDRS